MAGPDSQDRRDGFREDTLVPSAPRPIDEMWRELQQVVAAVGNTHLNALLTRIVAEHEAALRLWPAARVVHHAYRGGFLEHILTMAEAGRMLAVLYGANADLVVTGAILHDIGKLQELQYDTATTYTRDGNMIGHITLGSIMVHDACRAIAGFPDALRAQVLHLIGSHHGERALGSPVEPLSIEAFILSAVDDLDATINQVQAGDSRRRRQQRVHRLSLASRTRAVEGRHDVTRPGAGPGGMPARRAPHQLRGADGRHRSRHRQPKPSDRLPRTQDSPRRRSRSLSPAAPSDWAMHEGGHLLMASIFGADPGVKRVSFGPVPFFAISHDDVSPATRVRDLGGRILGAARLERMAAHTRPGLRHEHAPVAKGLLAFNVLASVAYATAAFGTFGPYERDTRAMADALACRRAVGRRDDPRRRQRSTPGATSSPSRAGPPGRRGH